MLRSGVSSCRSCGGDNAAARADFVWIVRDQHDERLLTTGSTGHWWWRHPEEGGQHEDAQSDRERAPRADRILFKRQRFCERTQKAARAGHAGWRSSGHAR
eukprot:5763884-Pleurochrysis_carterae.AAC.1